MIDFTALEAISTAIIAAVAGFSTLVFQRKTMIDQWRSEFDSLHSDFWENENAAKVRRWIANELEYAKLEDVLTRRMSGPDISLNSVDAHDNAILEQLDQFLSVLLRVVSFGGTRMTKQQRQLFRTSFEFYWFSKLRDRTVLMDYIDHFWDGFLPQNGSVS